jgi:hypothetical protein
VVKSSEAKSYDLRQGSTVHYSKSKRFRLHTLQYLNILEKKITITLI